ncbi:MAG: methylmalonyl-CoA mutase family protein, partial [Gammaproteobacteria bacterium]|nr:methylmalonyl-CoA mutase family protein [Gammaproteobacteria bacterium]
MATPAAATDIRAQAGPEPARRLRFVTAASLFDGHDASINIMRRILQGQGAEVIHLGHNRAVEEIVTAALQEDVHGIAVSSYQGGHVEFFKYMVDMLRERGGAEIRVFGGGGGVIVPKEIKELHEYGVTRIYAPEDGQRMGLAGMIDDMMATASADLAANPPSSLDDVGKGDHRALARLITCIEAGTLDAAVRDDLIARVKGRTRVPVVGITGTGGAGKSSLTDEIIRRFRLDHEDRLRIAVIAVDPSRRKTGGALLGDRIRMNAIDHPNIYMRSLATRVSGSEIPETLPQVIAAARVAGFDLVIVETSGIGQGDAEIVPHVDLSMYVMTPEFGAASQLEKIDMLDFADLVAINKFDRKGGRDALRDVRKQMQRNRQAFGESADAMPVYGTIASRFNDDGVTALYQALAAALEAKGKGEWDGGRLPRVDTAFSSSSTAIVPASRVRYLAEVAETVRGYHETIREQVKIARERQQLREAKRILADAGNDVSELDALIGQRDEALDPRARKLLEIWPKVKESYSGDEYVVKIRDKEIRTALRRTTLSGSSIPKVAVPRYEDDGEILRFLLRENLPGSFPYTAGVFAFKREGEEPSRMFAGEGDAFRTNRRFKYLSKDSEAKRLSTAFDSVTLYG